MKCENVFSEKVANSIDAMLAYWDENQICRFANAAYLDWFGKKSEDMIDTITLKELLGPLYQLNLPFIKRAYDGHVQIFERDIPTPCGKIKHSLATYTPDIVNGKVNGIIVHVADITNIKNFEIELQKSKLLAEELATHDYLTKLPNRVLLGDRINNCILISERRNSNFAVSIMDLDNFKMINDSFGHLTGDLVLVEVASRSQSALREYDSISRFGGDEFVILLPEIEHREQIENVGHRLLEFNRMPIYVQSEVIYPSCSLGIAIYPDHGSTMEMLLRNADIALYKAKTCGKNCFCFVDQ